MPVCGWKWPIIPISWNVLFTVRSLGASARRFPLRGRPCIQSVTRVLSILCLASDLPDSIGLVRVMELKLFF